MLLISCNLWALLVANTNVGVMIGLWMKGDKIKGTAGCMPAVPE